MNGWPLLLVPLAALLAGTPVDAPALRAPIHPASPCAKEAFAAYLEAYARKMENKAEARKLALQGKEMLLRCDPRETELQNRIEALLKDLCLSGESSHHPCP
jgi:hypothetical protein